MKEALRIVRAQIIIGAANEGLKTRQTCSVPIECLVESLGVYLTDNPETNLSLKDAAEILGREPSNCSKVFRRITGKCFKDWERDIKIGVAQQLLARHRDPIYMIAMAVGYRNVTTFQRNFKKCLGVSPRQFRRACQSEESSF
jgi:AraC-like DNA-binding protein